LIGRLDATGHPLIPVPCTTNRVIQDHIYAQEWLVYAR
jgi:hypothetical protein